MANNLITYDTTYLTEAIQALMPGMVWDQLITERMLATNIQTLPVPSGSVSIVIDDSPDADTTVLPADGSAANTQDINQRAVKIDLKEYGEGVIKVPAAASLTAVTETLMDAVKMQSRKAAKTLEKLVGDAVNVIPPSGTWTYADKTYDVQADGLVHLGTGTTTKAARTDVTSSDTLTADMLRLAYAKLTARGARKFITSAGDVYVAVVHPNVAYDLKKQSDAGSWQDAARFIDAAYGIKYGVIGVYEGFLFLESTYGTDLGNVGADTNTDGTGQRLYRTYFFGASYLGKGYASQDMLPISDPNAEIMPLSESVQIRVVPAYDSHGRHKNVVWYGFLGYGLVEPDAGFIVESASSLDPVE